MAFSTANVRVETAAPGFGAEGLDLHGLADEREGARQAGDQFQVLAGIGKQNIRNRAGGAQRRLPDEGRGST